VTRAGETRPISFKLDVMPVLMKAGCNTGSCHGSASGQDGFHLSLFGFDPDSDYHNITRELAGRRINLALPEYSLIVLKALGKVQHTGGEPLTEDSEQFRTLLRWLKAGVPKDSKDVAKPTGIRSMPKQIVLNGKGATQQLTVHVTYSDGTDRDVTSLAVFRSNNGTSATVDGNGLITADERGEAFIMARYASFSTGTQTIVVPKNLPHKFPKSVKEHNYIDTLVHTKLKKLRIAPSEICSDEQFLRRIYLDIVGLLPDRAAYDRFMEGNGPNKRAALIDELLGRKEFVELWVMKWAELLKIRSVNNRFSYKSTMQYYGWLQNRIANNVPIDEVVQELIASTGGTFKNPATNFFQVETNTLKISENVAQVFMGMRIQCAQCHNHPFDQWTMDDYYSFANFFSRIGRKKAEDPRETIIYDRSSGDTKHPVGNRVLAPKFLGGATPVINGSTKRRQYLADWLTSPDNPYFSKNLSNIIWAHFFGRGIVEPVDDVRISNPAVNPELLDELGKRLVKYNYDFKALIRDICNSHTYQLSTKANSSNLADESNFSKAPIRRIRAEFLLDCISQVTGTQDKFKGLPKGARAVQIADGSVSNYFLTTFGRSSRETVCSCEVVTEPNLSQALHLINGNTVNKKVIEGALVKRLLDEKKSEMEVVEDLYISCLSRKPTLKETRELAVTLVESTNKQSVLEDIFWALLNSKEFIFNH